MTLIPALLQDLGPARYLSTGSSPAGGTDEGKHSDHPGMNSGALMGVGAKPDINSEYIPCCFHNVILLCVN
jgi:hypothetical protein